MVTQVGRFQGEKQKGIGLSVSGIYGANSSSLKDILYLWF